MKNTQINRDITINNKIKFARDGAVFIPCGHPIGGIYKVRKNGILFSDLSGEPFAFLVANPGQTQFFVSAFRQNDGRMRYMFGLSSVDEARLGLSDLSYGEQGEEAARVWAQVQDFANAK